MKLISLIIKIMAHLPDLNQGSCRFRQPRWSSDEQYVPAGFVELSSSLSQLFEFSVWQKR